MLKKILLPVLLFFILTSAYAQQEQDRVEQIKNKLEILKVDIPGLTKKVDISVNGVTLEEFLRGIANTYKINISVSPDLTMPVSNNFSNIDVADLLIFLVKKYNLNIDFSGTILSISKYNPPKKYSPKEIHISVDSTKKLLSFELRNDTLFKVFKKITDLTGKNLVFSPGMENKLLNGYVKNMPVKTALDNLAYANNLVVEKTKDDFYLFSPNEKITNSNRNTHRFIRRNSRPDFDYKIVDKEKKIIDVDAKNTPIGEIIENIGRDLGINIFNFVPLKGNIEITVKDIYFDKLLDKLLENTQYTYLKQDSIYYVGEKKQAALRSSVRVYLLHRSVEGLLKVIPSTITQGLEVKEAIGLNSFLVSGPNDEVLRFEKFVKKIDQPVPVILIEVMIVVVKKSSLVETGIEMGIGDKPVNTTGTIFPGLNMTFGANTINKIIGGFNGFGALNLGNVTPNFYMTLKAMEENGNISIQSTPRLATLNGHKATMKVGEKTYYVEERNDYVGSQIPQTYTTKTYKAVNAELKLEIKPIVAGDNQITLNILLEQSDFKGQRIEKGAPPGQNFRQFNSLIRVHNNDVVILGGLEIKSKDDSGKGVPVLSRIPVIKWFFSSRKREDSKERLSLFIKSTIIK